MALILSAFSEATREINLQCPMRQPFYLIFEFASLTGVKMLVEELQIGAWQLS